MRIRFSILVLACFLLAGWPAFGQDLGQLPPRVLKLWGFRKQSNKLDALPFIDPQTRQTYMQWTEAPISNFKISALEFTDDPNRIDVVLKVRAPLPQIGEVDRMVRETWIWKDGEWLMEAVLPPDLFSSESKGEPASAERVPPKFEVANTAIDLGRHVQGDLIEGKIPFRADHADTVLIRPLRGIAGLSVGAAIWTSPMEGYLPYRWETTLVSQDVNQSILLEATGTNDAHATVPVQFRVRIDGKIGFKQLPEIIDPTRAGQLELQIQNLTKTPLTILSVRSNNPAYTVRDEDISELIAPGKSGHIVVRYSAQAQATGGSLSVTFSEKLTSSAVTTLPLNVKLPDDRSDPAAREEFDRIINKALGPPR